jgi:hypothetical protein
MAKYSSKGAAKSIFIRHHGAIRKDIHFRVNPQALRVQQGNKGSVVDTLGGYFREVMYSEDPQHSGLLLPDLTIECETGAGYREELKKFEWVWRHHGDAKGDGTPADTYLMDFADPDTQWFDGALSSGGLVSGGGLSGPYRGHQNTVTDVSVLKGTVPTQARIHEQAFSLPGLFNRTMRSGMGQSEGTSRFTPRVFKIELLNFAWDETVQDPYRIRFNFRCKILRDMLWRVEQRGASGKTMFSLGDIGGVLGGNLGDGASGWGMGGGGDRLPPPSPPLNVAAQVANIQTTNSQFGLPASISTQVEPLLGKVLNLAGLGENRVATKALAIGQSAFGLTQPTYPSGTEQDRRDLNALLTELIKELPEILGVEGGTTIQVGEWSVPIPDEVSELANINLGELSFHQPTVDAITETGDRFESEAWT